MATCPSCSSARLRVGYRTAPLPLRLIGFRTLLCDNCNFEFRAFSPREPKRAGGRRSKRKADVFNEAPAVDLQTLDLAGSARRAAPAVHFDRAALPTQAPEPAPATLDNGLPPDFEEDFQPAPAPAALETDPEDDFPPASTLAALETDPEDDFPSTEPLSSVPEAPSIRAQIAVPPPALPTEEPLMKLKEELEERRKHGSSHTCPHCGSHDVNRRHRKTWQKIVFGLTSIRPYRCENCGGAFYARRQPHQTRDSLARKEAEFVKNSCFNQTEQPSAGEQGEGQHG